MKKKKKKKKKAYLVSEAWLHELLLQQIESLKEKKKIQKLSVTWRVGKISR